MSAPFGAESPLYVAVRAITFLGILGVIGVAAFGLVVLPLVARQRSPAGDALLGPARAGALRFGLVAVALLALATVLRLLAQSHAVHGGEGALDPRRMASLLTRSAWGWGWLAQAAAVAVGVVGHRLAARRSDAAGWVLIAGAAITLAVTPALSGHALSARGGAGVAVIADALHVLGAGGWLGSLLVLVTAGIPAAWRLDKGTRGAAVAALVHAFSPTALIFAGVVVATGIFASWQHVGSVAALWSSDYGRLLLLKLAVLSLVFGTGAYNFLRVRPALGAEAGVHRLRRASLVELAVGAVVVVITAVLVATSPPEESRRESGAVPAEEVVQGGGESQGAVQ